jgi:tetratricopeptide (TPR) repeat protein
VKTLEVAKAPQERGAFLLVVFSLLVLVVATLQSAAHAQGAQFQALYDAGKYRESLKHGAQALVENPQDGKLRLSVANALAWTGRYDAAVEQYERLASQAEYSAAARTGIANVLRWRGAAPVAMPLLKNTPEPSALEQNLRETRANAGVRMSRANDSSGLTRNDLQLNQRFVQTDTFLDRPVRWDLAAIAGRDLRLGKAINHREIALSLGISAVGWGDKAASQWAKDNGSRFEISAQNDLKTRVYGRAHIDFWGDTFSVRAGHVNWGRQAFSQAALLAGLTANQLGSSVYVNSDLATIRMRLDAYSLSDNNRVLDGELGIQPGWQPLPWGLQWYNNLAFRKADRVDSNYWSPKRYVTSTLGLKRSWYFDSGEFNLSVGRSFGLSVDAKDGYIVSANGKMWVSSSTSLSLDVSASDAPRVGAYRYHAVGVSLNQLW